MRTVEEHLRLILDGIKPLEPFEVALTEATGCVLAEDVVTEWPLPSFDNASMDGYAVRAEDVVAASAESFVELSVIDDVPAGYRATEVVRPGTAIRIMTGAPLPTNATAVVPIEWTDGGMSIVRIYRPAAVNAHIRRTGEDVRRGEIVLQAGTPLGARQIALLAAIGKSRVMTRPRPRVVIITTGSELVEPGTPLTPGLVADSNGIMLTVAARQAGGDAFRVGPVPDDDAALLGVIEDQLVRADIIVTSGGVSMGAYDTVKSVLSQVGTVEFVRVAMQPGMPQGFGTLGPDSIPIYTLPGNPVSSYVSFEVFVRPVIRKMLGHTRAHRPMLHARLLNSLTSPEGKTQFARGQLSVDDNGYTVTALDGQGSHMLGDLAASDALIVVPADVTELHEGAIVEVLDLETDA